MDSTEKAVTDTLLVNQKLYKDQVAAHFDKTSALFNEVTSSYKTLHDHFKNTSMQLNNQTFEANAQFAEIEQSGHQTYKRRAAEIGLTEQEDMSTPRDYAPKDDPKDLGQLTEGYGLSNETDESLMTETPDFSMVNDEQLESTPTTPPKS